MVGALPGPAGASCARDRQRLNSAVQTRGLHRSTAGRPLPEGTKPKRTALWSGGAHNNPLDETPRQPKSASGIWKNELPVRNRQLQMRRQAPEQSGCPSVLAYRVMPAELGTLKLPRRLINPPPQTGATLPAPLSARGRPGP